MRKGTFSGISILEGEGITEAGASFGGQDRSIIDRLLEVGAVTHRHDAHAPLPDPIGPPSAAITASGGAIPADRTIYVGFTLLDSSGGETLLSDVEIETTGAQYDAPTTAPEASADYSAGSLLIGTYHYAITFTDGIGGETSIGPPVLVTRDPGYASGQVHLWGFADALAEADAAGWRLYRATGGGQYDFLAEGTSDTFTDTGAIPLNCAVHPPTLLANSTVGANLLTVVVASGSANVSSAATGFNLYLSEDGTFEDPCLYGTYPPSSAGVPIEIPSLLLLQGAPPLVSTALRGANQIDPDTELIDWHWKRPVGTVGDLPPAASGSVDGDVRVVKSDHLPRVFDGSAWSLWVFGAGTITAQGSAGVRAIRLVGSGEVGVSAATTSAGETTWTIFAPPDVEGSGGVGGSGTGIYELDSGVVGWKVAGTPDASAVVRLKGTTRTDYAQIIDQPYSAGAGSLGDHYATDGAGNAIPEAGGNNLNDIHYEGLSAVIQDGYVERQVTIASVNWTRTGVTFGHGRKGLFAYITRSDGVLHVAWRDTDTNNEADFHDIATDTLPALPGIGDTYNIQLEKVGNELWATVFQSKAVVAECGGTIPTAMQAEYGADQALYPGLSDRWSNPDAWTTDFLNAFWYQYHHELWAEVDGATLGGTQTRLLLDDLGERTGDLSSLATPLGYSSTDWADGSMFGVYMRRDYDHYVTLGGMAVKSAGSAPVSGDIIGTVDTIYCPTADQYVPVVTGDDDGEELGMLKIDQGGIIYWLGGRSTTPNVKHPFVSLDGISYRAA
jgi:hypothetical protein